MKGNENQELADSDRARNLGAAETAGAVAGHLWQRYARFYSDTTRIERRYSLLDRYEAVRTFIHAISYLAEPSRSFNVETVNAQSILRDGIMNAIDHRSTGREWRNVRHGYHNERDGPYPPTVAEVDRRCDRCGAERPKPFSHCYSRDHRDAALPLEGANQLPRSGAQPSPTG